MVELQRGETALKAAEGGKKGRGLPVGSMGTGPSRNAEENVLPRMTSRNSNRFDANEDEFLYAKQKLQTLCVITHQPNELYKLSFAIPNP